VIGSSGLLTTNHITESPLRSFFKRTKLLENRELEAAHSPVGVLAFFEPSTRTRFSFERAGLSLGIQWISISPGDLSLVKGETLKDTFSILRLNRPDFFVVRHSLVGFPSLVQSWSQLPVINAGDGAHQHPTQALADAYTLWKTNSTRRFKITFYGDVYRSRLTRSNIPLFQALGYSVSITDDGSIETKQFAKAFKLPLLPRKNLSKMDIVFCLRVQEERGSQKRLPPFSLGELGETAKIMHAGPVVIGQDLEVEACDFEADYSLVHQQVESGLTVRRQLLYELTVKRKERLQ